MKLNDRDLPHLHQQIFTTLVWAFLSFWILASCEISDSVPFDLPDYDEELIIHAVASPQSGGRAVIKYSQPVAGFPGKAPELPDIQAFLTHKNQQIVAFQLDSVSVVKDNNFFVQTIFLSIPPDSLQIEPGQFYAMEVFEPGTQNHYRSSLVRLPLKPIVEEFNMNCTGSGCIVTCTLGSVYSPVHAISINGKFPEDAIEDNYKKDLNNQIFNNDLIYPAPSQWERYDAISDFAQIVRRNPHDTLAPPVDIRVSISYLSSDIAQLIREIHGTHSIGEDIFQPIRPFHSNFHTEDGSVFGVFGLYNEDIRVIPL